METLLHFPESYSSQRSAQNVHASLLERHTYKAIVEDLEVLVTPCLFRILGFGTCSPAAALRFGMAATSR